MIISASRRTDVPAFYTPWLMERVRAQYCTVVNPFNNHQVIKVSLRPEEVDAFVFWTRNPSPLRPHLPELDRRGYCYYFLFTITGYGPPLEENNPPVREAVENFKRLAGQIGPDRVVWRYDPLIISAVTGSDFHRHNFARLAGELAGSCRRVIISFLEGYPKTRRELQKARIDADFTPPAGWLQETDFRRLLADLAGMAAAAGMDIQSCAGQVDLTPFGIPPGKCIDDGLLAALFGIEVSSTKDKSQRPACRCVISRDIGAYHTCLHGCRYCYATSSLEAARKNWLQHDPAWPSLLSRGHFRLQA